MPVSCECLVLSGKGLYETRIPRPAESYGVCVYVCVCVCAGVGGCVCVCVSVCG
jgi:hypothetical protein